MNDKADRLKDYYYKSTFFDQYGEPVYDKENNKIIGYKLNDTEYATVHNYLNLNNKLCNEVSIKDFNAETNTFGNETLISWIDIKTDKGFIREYEGIKYFYDADNKIYNVEKSFNCQDFPVTSKESTHNKKIGTLDLETFGDNSGLGYHLVYAGGWSIENKTELFYLEPGETGEQLVSKMFSSILSKKELNGYTFYAHNLGRFDSVFIIKSLIINENISLTPIWKDNTMISLTISYNDFKITLLDSLLLISGSLENILKSFDCKIKKGYFPYSFVNQNNLFYIGDKPNKNHYSNISDQEYLNIEDNNWDLQQETLSYLRTDLEGLLEVMIKFNNNIFSSYDLNITKFKTLPSLALAVYTSNYLPDNLKTEVKMIKGELEKEIRLAYFGGNVDVFINKITNAYLYDMNSQYPEAMLKDMPVGEPVFSLETNLDSIFGFVYGEITAPDEQSLRVPFIQYKDPFTHVVSCPRGKFKRLIFSQEIKYALKFGYKVEIKYCYQFKRGKGLFTKYENDLYKLKKTANDSVQRATAKLFLNSLYGRMGMKDIESTLKIVDAKEVFNLDKNRNISVISNLSDNKYLVKYNGQISDSIRKLYSKDPLKLSNKTTTYDKNKLKSLGLNKSRETPSAVHIAAAISAYARISINEFKNIPGNPCIMSDTDSAVLPYPLPDHLVGSRIGQMKLVHKIEQGIFIRKKLYAIIDKNKSEIIKSSGINPDKLNYKLFKFLLKGESVVITDSKFNLDWKTLNVNVVETKTKVQGLIGELKTIYNTTDVNFKAISFPIKYSLILHPLFFLKLYPVLTHKENLNKIEYLDENKESDLFLIFSKSEIILFFIFIFLFISLIFIYIHFIKI